MLEILELLGFLFLFLRFSYWIGLSLGINDPRWKQVLLSQCWEGLFLFFLFSQLFGGKRVLPMQQSLWTTELGFLLICLGVAGMLVAKKQLGTAWAYAVAYRITPKQKLITKGMYAVVRHPIYTCFIIGYVGAELLAGSWLWVSLFFLLVPFYFQAKKEEVLLVKHFGKKYKQYQQKTKMLIPFVL